ncbi:hypothetical protein EHE19_018145 [Ruminiclostridium herbifermentans]|uniref:Uncharacterized protein n=1 Tax=Ruminiclostridium herbifermentans TaxID=2488810 RepID=A0A7H1VMX2_9FIRM|nr:hypothetical protein [Ruminiclostridium herbifermentans]QNU66734.1 hypothetical protein EHE19_018145 [Ruminiclostridium herbifermentans]
MNKRYNDNDFTDDIAMLKKQKDATARDMKRKYKKYLKHIMDTSSKIENLKSKSTT